MPLFQKSVLSDYLKKQDAKAVQKAYKTFTAYFHQAGVQQNIRKSKEEQFQATFLSKLFEEALGYTLFPQPKHDLTTEFKNEKGAKKADGALVKDGKAMGVIELKSTKTKDLESIRQQAFDYKANHSDCRYVVTSNFEKLRFYINDAVDWLEFDLFTLTLDEFALLYLCLQRDHIFKDLPQQIKKESVLQEEKITKSLYQDYSRFRMELYRDLIKRNRYNAQLKELSETSIKRTLFKKTQKLLDRFLFIFFAEDRGLIPRNMIVKINKEWRDLQKMRGTQSLYERYRLYFTDLNEGNREQDIFAYNGGLFEPDPVLDHAEIDDELLYRHTEKLTAYDFESEVDVNILGHIFEHSLNEIESVNAEIEGETFDKQKARRKKDGVFYTPRYITKYIVDHTLGKLCSEKRQELGIAEEEYFKGRKNRKKETLEALLQKLTDYREWLLQLTVCDPACGSGAFLNQALEFLIAEHRQMDEYRAKLLGEPLTISDIENRILENNLYGVDINQESVEIAKLSLWLRTAQRGRKLTSLSHNIKTGNSLIDSVKVAGDKAFKWEKEFPQVFAKGGFDVVIGNPPYVHLESIREVSQQLSALKYETYDKRGDLYPLFVEKGMDILKPSGLLSFIMPNKWLQAGYGKSLREYFLKSNLLRLIDFGDFQIFQGATTYPCIFISEKKTPSESFEVSVLKSSSAEDFDTHVIETKETFKTKNFSGKTWVISSNLDIQILERLKVNFQTLSDFIGGEANYGIKPGLTEAFIIDELTKNTIVTEDTNASEIIHPVLRGRDIMPWHGIHQGAWMICTFPALNISINDYPSVKKHFLDFGEKRLSQSGEKGSRKKTNNKWFETQDTIAYHADFKKPKIMYQTFQVKPCFIYDEQGLYCNNSMWIIPTDSKALVGVLNSKTGWWLINKYCTQIQNGCQLIWKYFGQIPVPNLDKAEGLEKRSSNMIEVVATRQSASNSFLSLLQSKFTIDKLSRKLQNWPSLDFKGFLKELKKAKVQLSLAEEAEWMAYFNTQKAQVQVLQKQADALDREIDQMVYALYGLTEEEIAIVENT